MRFRSFVLSAIYFAASPAQADEGRPEPSESGELGRSARLETVLRVALERNRDLAEGRERALAAESRGRAAARLPDLELKYEQWGVPLARPVSLDQAETIMVGLRQTFPAWGTLEARGRAGQEEAGAARDGERTRRLEVAAQVHRAFAAYYGADQELRLHLEHVGLTSRLLELARLGQRTGHGSLQDALRLQLELTRLHADVARLQQNQGSSRALLNSLMDRAPDAPLGPPEAPSLEPTADIPGLERDVASRRPEVAAASRAVRRSEANLDGTRRGARIPSLMIGLDYWYLPAAERHNAYGAMVSMNLPWLSGRWGDQEKEAEHTLRADQHALEATRNVVRYQLRDAAARVEAARQSFSIIDQDLLVQARQNFEATQSAYGAGQGDASGLIDALRSYLQVRIERVRALTELASSEADLRRAAGTLAPKGNGP